MRLLTMMVRPLAALVLVVAFQACAPPEGMPEIAADAALDAQEAVESKMAIVLPSGVEKLKCNQGGGGATTDNDTIGPDGGVLETKAHRLEIPEGALEHDIKFRMKDLKKESGEVMILPATTFEKGYTATLTASYGHCTKPAGKEQLDLYRGDPTNSSRLPTTVDETAKTVTSELDHLSTYIIGAM